ncbi:hypothetical protein T03_16598 [Trichinella britovi]|uniref:Uncharacterized protein n=1 Tax=Trichinella britovi TaxID=45882 RepID=A0A0V1CIJ5_TRIBR|nr:hypothetical protein T03_16598 [Trichinella britovi]
MTLNTQVKQVMICSPAASFDLSDPSDRNPFYNSQPSFMLKRLFTFVFARKMLVEFEETYSNRILRSKFNKLEEDVKFSI